MAFITLKTIVFQNKKTRFNFAIFFLLLSVCYLVSLRAKNDITVVMRRSQKYLIFKEFVMTLLF